jgi:hypothetical protein
MKTLRFKISDRITTCKSILTAAVCLFSGILSSSASVTVQGWWHLDNAQPITDSSGNGRTFGSAYSTSYTGGGEVRALLINNGVGGPLGGTGWVSTNCVRVGVTPDGSEDQDVMWDIGYNPPAENFGIEIWVLPQGTGVTDGGNGWIFSTGESGGVALRANTSGGTNYIDAFDLSTGDIIGTNASTETNVWLHLAIVNAAGTTTFYTNGVPCGPSYTTPTSASAGSVCMFASQGDNSAFNGYCDEARMFTFAAGAFTTNDLLLRPAGPNLIAQPQSEVVWSGGAAPFSTVASFDFYSVISNLDQAQLYQWTENGAAISGATNSSYLLPVATGTDSGSNFQCVVTIDGLSVTTSPPATLSVVTNNAADVAAYQSLVSGTTGILGYFPVDNCTGSVATNVIDATHNGTLENDASYDGRTNRAFGQRALSFDGNADVEVPNDAAYEFTGGFGTIEALVYLDQTPVQAAAIFSENYDQDATYYALLSDPTGDFLLYTNDQLTTSLSWSVPGGLLGRFLDIALVIDNVTNVTPYVNGQSLGTQQQPSFGSIPGGSFWIGGQGDLDTDFRWSGTIDELAIFGTNLPVATIQAHYTKFVFGTNVVPPVITGQSIGKTVLAGGSPVLTATATGGLPLSYQWTSNSIPIAGATSPTLVLSNSMTNYSATYSLTISNVFGSTNAEPIVMTFEAPPAGYETTVMNDHPTAFWRLADTAGPTAVDSAGLNDAIYTTNGVTYSAGGPSFDTNAGALFDGSSGRAVTPENYPDINPSGPFTIEFWANVSAYASEDSVGHFYSPISSMPRPSRTGGYEWYMGGNSSGYEFHTAEDGGYSLITADNNEPPVGTWWYLTGIWDGTNLMLYVNGSLGNDQIDPPAPAGTDNFTDEGQGQTAFVPNTSVPFYIGSRSDGNDHFFGALADIAFYNYALSYEQVTNHWSAIWSPANVLTPPGVTNVEGSTITLTPTVTGLPNSYQWCIGSTNTPLNGAALNSDGSLHYPNGVNSASLVIAQAEPTLDSGEYFLAVTNPVQNADSGAITVLVTPNTVPPAVVSVTGLGTPGSPNTSFSANAPFLVKVVFSKRVDPTTGSNPANYVFSPAVAINSMTLLGGSTEDLAAESLGADWRVALLATKGLKPGQQYSLTISGLKDQSETPLTMPTSVTPFSAPVLSQGVVNWDYYYLGANTADTSLPSTLQADPNFQAGAPQTNSYFTNFDSHQITGGTLSDNPTFGALGDNYGDCVSGWITPTVSDNYTFFLDSDDEATLYLSSDTNAANAAQIVSNPSCCTGFLETNNSTVINAGGLGYYVSNPQALTAGQSYYIQALHGQGGGGDYVRVAWRGTISTDQNTPAADLLPIPGTYLSAYANLAPLFSTPALTNGTLTLNWSGAKAIIQQSTNLISWTNVPGNPSPLVVPVNSGTNTLFFRLIQSP